MVECVEDGSEGGLESDPSRPICRNPCALPVGLYCSAGILPVILDPGEGTGGTPALRKTAHSEVDSQFGFSPRLEGRDLEGGATEPVGGI